MTSLLLLLADGRFPAGSHAHSGGLEEAVAAGRVRDEGSLYGFLAGRLSTAGLVDSALAAAAWSVADRPDEISRLDSEAAARCPSASLREASRSLGRALVRAGLAVWPGEARAARPKAGDDWPRDATGEAPSVGADEPRRVAPWQRERSASGAGLMSPVALGLVGKRGGLTTAEVALVAAQTSVSMPAWAATRLLGLDPFAVGRCLARLAGAVEEVVAGALALAGTAASPALLPAVSSPLIEIGAEAHARWEVHLFAS